MAEDLDSTHARPLALYERVEAMIREEIERENLQPGSRLPTELEMCKRFEVSRSTVRQSLNRLEVEGLISRTRGKGTFLRAAPSHKALIKADLTGRPIHAQNILGLVFCARSDTLQMNILLGVERAAKSHGYAIMFGYSGEDVHTEEQEVERLLRHGTSGVIVMPVSNVTRTSGVQKLMDQQVPLVLVDRYLSDLDTSFVVSDGFDGMYRITEHLIILGYESLTFITSGREELSTTSVRDRYRGFRQALEDYSIANLQKSFVAVNLDDCQEVGHLIRTRNRHHARPNAFVAVHDAVAISFMRSAASLGYTPPDDFGVVGFDDLPSVGQLTVPLTTVAQPRFDMGFKAGHLLIDLIEGRTKQVEKLTLPVALVVRDSCGSRRIVRERQQLPALD